ncbi:hypothetical protein HC031_20795 [Planosporangium thailandense]|uniref:Uncharacterized protein n=1 Tax=Planosporangium thailandense TaxID=765197 RepID=A0ABX0Y1A0_9ACTN|nr:hypothetical protein [Planosporangium thailandense]NJC72135.1 hypothetical protein [Planosporangium thailandense]
MTHRRTPIRGVLLDLDGTLGDHTWPRGVTAGSASRGSDTDRLRVFLPAVGVAYTDDDAYLDPLFGGYLRRYEASWRASWNDSGD